LIVCLLGAVELVRLATPYGASNQHSNNHCLRRTSAAFVTSVKKFPLTCTNFRTISTKYPASRCAAYGAG
ncbi:MAG: hypothetical protein IJY75_01465, partial [Bacteroidaceae bacterium]|nr:hypothetical protein [Bacteroidaceae bacterium]